MRPHDTRTRTGQILDAYLQLAAGAMVLRHPKVQRVIVETIPTIGIASSFPGQDLLIHTKQMTEDIQAEGLNNPPQLRNALTSLNALFLVGMWDTLLTHRDYHQIATQPDVQFLRHVRNACAHDGLFNFTTLEHQAKWRTKHLTLDDRNTAVFPSKLSDGDAILLVLDINERYFNPSGVPGHELPAEL